MNRWEIGFASAGWVAILVWMAAGTFPAATARAAAPEFTKKMRVLFIGNSYTYVNDLPRMLKGLMAVKAIDLETRRVTPGCCMLAAHWKSTDTRKAIAEGPWDYVVIQEQSQMPVFNPSLTLKYAALLAEMVHKVGAEPVFYMTWARKNKPSMPALWVSAKRSSFRAISESSGLMPPSVSMIVPCWLARSSLWMIRS